MSEENEKQANDNKEGEISEKRESLDNNEQKQEFNLSTNIEENLIKDINEDAPKLKKRNFGIDLIRVIACFLVMQTHSGEIYYINDDGSLNKNKNNIWPGIFNSTSRVCVPLFVMISGYLLLPIKTDYRTFFKKRFTRISFPFIAFCIFYDIFFYIKGDIDMKTMFINIPKIFINYGAELGHLWFMYMIMGVYLLMPIFSPWIKSAKKEHFYFYFTIWLISSFSHYIHLAFPQIWGEVHWNHNTVVQGFIGDFGYAVLGAFIKLHLKETKLYLLSIILYIVGTGITMFGFIYRIDSATTCEEVEITFQFDSFNVIIASFGAFLLLRNIECKNEKIVKIFNDIAIKSYGMYLIHIFFIFLFRYLLDAPNQFPLWCIFVVALLSFIISYVVIKALSYIPYSQYIIG